MSVAPGDCNPTRAVCRFIAQSRARTGSFCGSVKGRPASLYVGWVSKAHPPAWQFYSTIAYPRSRGEHVEDVQRQYVDYGLSPLARGTLANHPAVIARNRFIPAGAGNTLPGLYWPERWPVYPRSRGEHRWFLASGKGEYGLSPLAPGTRNHALEPGAQNRFIPARAGNTSALSISVTCYAVYPRSRGEHSKTIYLYLLHFFSNILPTFGLQSRIVKERLTY